MKQFNIYAGLLGRYGGAQYQYTTLFENDAEALNQAHNDAIEIFEQNEGCLGIPRWEGFVSDCCDKYGMDITHLSENDCSIIERDWEDMQEEWLDFRVILTERDNIDPEDLILDYIIDDDSGTIISE